MAAVEQIRAGTTTMMALPITRRPCLVITRIFAVVARRLCHSGTLAPGQEIVSMTRTKPRPHEPARRLGYSVRRVKHEYWLTAMHGAGDGRIGGSDRVNTSVV